MPHPGSTGIPGTQDRLFSCVLATIPGMGDIAMGPEDGAAMGTATVTTIVTTIGMVMADAIAAAKA